VGTILNPIAHQGQIDGAVMQSVGYVLMEELQYDEGRVTTLSFGEYKIPTMGDIPELRTVLVPSASGGPTPLELRPTRRSCRAAPGVHSRERCGTIACAMPIRTHGQREELCNKHIMTITDST